MTHHEDAPIATFRTIYSALTWAGLAFLLALLVWLLWTMFQNTPLGTDRSRAMAEVAPTVEALAAGYAVDESGVRIVELPGTCAACHAIAGTSATGAICPDLTLIGAVAAERIASPEYAGTATTVEAYIRESILEPNAYVVRDKDSYYTGNGSSVMPAAVGEALDTRELEQLVAYLATLGAE